MTSFQLHEVLLIAVWLALVAIRYRKSTLVLTGGMFAVGLYAMFALIEHSVSMRQLGLATPASWLATLLYSVGWLALMLAYSPVADWIATRLVAKPPNLRTFRTIQQSTAKLVLGIVVAWLLGGFLEELILRGIVLEAVEATMANAFPIAIAAVGAIIVAALGAGILHLYQGLRAAIIIAQLSILFGVLFVISGHNLWSVILCHGFYDTIAFIRFARGTSRYSQLDAS